MLIITYSSVKRDINVILVIMIAYINVYSDIFHGFHTSMNPLCSQCSQLCMKIYFARISSYFVDKVNEQNAIPTQLGLDNHVRHTCTFVTFFEPNQCYLKDEIYIWPLVSLCKAFITIYLCKAMK